MEENDLAAELVRRLEERGVPHGMWLVEIEEMRARLRAIDAQLLRLQDALIRAHDHGQGPLDGT